MNATRDRVFGLPRSRVLLGVLLALALMLSALGPAALVGVAAAPAEPVARLQVVVKEITVHKDHDPLFAGSGEMSLAVQVWRCNDGAPPPCSSQADPDKGHPGMLVDVADVLFSAETGDTVALGLVVPRDRAFPVFPGEPDVVRISLREWDGITSDPDEMGHVYHYLDTEERGLGLGTHTARSFKEEQYQWGDFTVTYEIRRAPLPDLRPVNIKVHDLPGSARNRVCMAVQNVELGEAGPHEVALQVDGVVPPGGRTIATGPAPGTAHEVCVEVALPTSGQHTLATVIDAPRDLAEYNEANNVYEQQYVATAPAAPATRTPSAALPDLTVSAVKVNGRVPDGKDDCKDGKNAVTVVVRNGGPVDAGDFNVQLVADDAQGAALRQSVDDGLGAGREVAVTFGGVRLKQGPHTLTATADATTGTGIAESNEGNNTRSVTVRCSDDD